MHNSLHYWYTVESISLVLLARPTFTATTSYQSMTSGPAPYLPLLVSRRFEDKNIVLFLVLTKKNLKDLQDFATCHRLNGSSSPVLWEIQKFDPHRIKTPDPIEIKFGTVDYVGEGTSHAKFYANSSKGAFRQMGEIYAKNFIHICLFSLMHPQVRPLKGFLRLIRQTTRFCTRKCLLGVRN